MSSWKQLRYRLEWFAIKAICTIVPTLPRNALPLLAEALGSIAYLVDRRSRGDALENLRIVLGETHTERQLQHSHAPASSASRRSSSTTSGPPGSTPTTTSTSSILSSRTPTSRAWRRSAVPSGSARTTGTSSGSASSSASEDSPSRSSPRPSRTRSSTPCSPPSASTQATRSSRRRAPC